jgi:hypothetical protein
MRSAQREHGHHVGRRLKRGDARGDALVDGEQRQVGHGGVGGSGRRLGAAIEHEDRLRSPPGDQPGGDQVGSLYEKGALTLAELAQAQRRRSLDERVLDTRDGGA